MKLIRAVTKYRNSKEALSDTDIALLVRYGIEFPDISNPHYIGDDDEQGYIDYVTTEGYRLRATGLKSITIKGSCCVPVELVENWGLDATESAVASTEFFVDEFELEK